MTDLAQLELDLINAIGAAQSVAAIEEVRVAALGKTGTVSALLKGMGALSPDERREQGPIINGLRDRVTAALTARKAELEAAELDARLRSASAEERAALQVELEDTRKAVRAEKISEIAAEFDGIHSIHRAVEVGSVDKVISAAQIRPAIIETIGAYGK